MRKFLLLIFCMASLVGMAQVQTKIHGKIKDENGQSIPSATVSLLKAKDSALVKLAVSDKTGTYEFINIKEGEYFIQVTSVGFGKSLSKKFTLSGTEVEIPSIALREQARNMNEVTVSAKKPFIETKLDKTIVNVDASPTSAGSTALEVLEKSPGIMVNTDGVISLRGKQGVIVMVDGKPTYLSPADLANLLKNMPASALETIEIMTNPSSRFDASGNSGVINIRTKKGKNDGFNGSVMVGVTSSIYKLEENIYLIPKSQNSFNFNYKKNKINLFGNYNPNYFRGRSTMILNSKQIDSEDGLVKGYTDQETRFKFRGFNQTLKLGLDWYPNKKNVFGIVASGFMFNGRPTPTTVADMSGLSHIVDTTLITNNRNNNKFRNFTGNLNWKHTFDSTGRELSADFDYVTYSNESNMFLETDIYKVDINPSQHVGHTELRGKIPVNINIYSVRSDYLKPIKNGRIEAGVKSSYVKTNNLVNYDTKFGAGDWKHDAVRSNHFIYEENVNAAYVTANKQMKKWTVQGGLRVENTVAKGNQLTTKVIFENDYTKLFPTAFVSYALNKKHSFTANYGRRILRPNYQDLNPFIFFLDTLSFRQGNIHLKPQFTHNFELIHAFKGKFITTLAYNITEDVISQIIKPVENSNGKIRFLTPDNVAELRNLSLSLSAPLTLAKWWNMNFFSSVYNNHYTGIYDTINIDLQFTSFTVNVTNSFTIQKGLSAEISGFYRYKTVDGLAMLQPLYQMSFGLQKQVMKGKGTVRLNVRDPFAWQKPDGVNKYGYVDLRFRNIPDSRQVTATFTLRFGKQTQQQQRRRGSSQEEQSRVGGAG